MKIKLIPLKIALIYSSFGGLWILFSDRILGSIIEDTDLLTRIQTYKGLLFIAVTAMLLYWLISRYFSEIKRSDDSMRRSEKKFRMLAENSQDVIYRMSLPDGRYEYVSPASNSIFGYSPEEFYDSPVLIQKIIHPDWHGYFKEQWEDLISGKMPPFYEYQIIHKSGEVRWLYQGNVLIKDKNGQPVAIEGIVSDITERKKAEEESIITNEELRAINRVITTTTTASGVNKILEKVMDEALSITGLEGGTICTLTPDDTLQLAVQRETSEATIIDLTTNEVKIGECLCGECARDHKPLILRNKEEVLKFATREATRGEDIRFHAAFPLIIGDRCLGVLCVFTRTVKKPAERRLKLLETITSQIAIAVDNAQMFEEISRHSALLEYKVKERTEELEQANIKLKELDKLKSMFIASMSHELRTPLNSIIGFTGIILQGMAGDINEEQRDQLQRVSKAGKHLLSLITDIIDISKIEAGRIEIYAEEFRLDELLNEIVSHLETEVTEKGLKIEVNMPQGGIVMKTDRKRLFQCVLNLFSNAVKFTEKGRITFDTRRKGDMIEIEVTDTGIGIKQEDLPLLFKSFVRIDSPLKMTTPGTGLGLYLTRKIATEILKGEVMVESEYGKGSRFMISIPVNLGSSSK